MTLTEDIRRTIAPEWEGFERLLTEALASRSDLLNRINTYLLDASGKKLRPLLALVTAKACSGSINQKAVACAAVSELIHTATLLHDDVVDDSDQRRGRMTVRKLFSPGASLLMGDYWLTRAIHLLIAYGCPVEVLGIYSKSLEELAEGEIIQMELADSLRATEDDYIQVIRRKTASLFIASVETGKDSDSDIMERKITMPLLCAMRNAPDQEEYIRRRMGDITCDPSKKEQDREVASEIRAFVLSHGGIESATGVVRDYSLRAQRCLEILKPSLSRDGLASIAASLCGSL